MLTIQDKRYIETMMDTKMRIFFSEEIKYHLAIQNEFFRDQIALVIEVVKGKPGKEEVREIAREEARDELRYHGLQR